MCPPKFNELIPEHVYATQGSIQVGDLYARKSLGKPRNFPREGARKETETREREREREKEPSILQQDPKRTTAP